MFYIRIHLNENIRDSEYINTIYVLKVLFLSLYIYMYSIHLMPTKFTTLQEYNSVNPLATSNSVTQFPTGLY